MLVLEPAVLEPQLLPTHLQQLLPRLLSPRAPLHRRTRACRSGGRGGSRRRAAAVSCATVRAPAPSLATAASASPAHTASRNSEAARQYTPASSASEPPALAVHAAVLAAARKGGTGGLAGGQGNDPRPRRRPSPDAMPAPRIAPLLLPRSDTPRSDLAGVRPPSLRTTSPPATTCPLRGQAREQLPIRSLRGCGCWRRAPRSRLG